MNELEAVKSRHLKGGAKKVDLAQLAMENCQGKIKVEIDEDVRTTAIGGFGFFVDFLMATGILREWIEESPLHYLSPNSPSKTDILGTALMSILSGHKRYSHVSALRSDQVNPSFLGMKRVVSEDSFRRAIKRMDADAARTWQQRNLLKTLLPLLEQEWILDIDTTVKPIYGHQEGAKVSYNPHKPGRPSHTYHTYIMGGTRLVLDAEVRPGNEHGPSYTRPELWRFLENLSERQRPTLIRGDAAFGSEETMCWPEENGYKYLFKLRQHANVKRLINDMELSAIYKDAGDGWQGVESTLRLSSWTRMRRVVILRREASKKKLEPKGDLFKLLGSSIEIMNESIFEHIVLITNLDYPIESLGQLYRDRADCENIFDELKNQWGWGGYTTNDIKRCQIMMRMVAQVYNWWSIFTHTIDRGHHHEAITTRPLMLSYVARFVKSSGQKILKISVNGKARRIVEFFSLLCGKIRDIFSSAEQFAQKSGWKSVLMWIFKPNSHGIGFT